MGSGCFRWVEDRGLAGAAGFQPIRDCCELALPAVSGCHREAVPRKPSGRERKFTASRGLESSVGCLAVLWKDERQRQKGMLVTAVQTQ